MHAARRVSWHKSRGWGVTCPSHVSAVSDKVCVGCPLEKPAAVAGPARVDSCDGYLWSRRLANIMPHTGGMLTLPAVWSVADENGAAGPRPWTSLHCVVGVGRVARCPLSRMDPCPSGCPGAPCPAPLVVLQLVPGAEVLTGSSGLPSSSRGKRGCLRACWQGCQGQHPAPVLLWTDLSAGGRQSGCVFWGGPVSLGW